MSRHPEQSLLESKNKEDFKFMAEMEESDLKIRPAVVEDFDTLTDISRTCFPDELRWRARRSHSRRWWGGLVNSNESEVWVGSINGEIIAFIIFTVNRANYEEAMQNQHYSFFDALSIFMYNPKRFYKKILFKIKQRKLKKALNTEYSTDDSQLNTYRKTKDVIKKCIPWCGPIAVLPSIRGNGVSLKMMEHCFNKAKSLGYKEIYTFVVKGNMMSRIMLAIADFKVIEEVDYRIFLKKTFEINDDKRVD